MSALLAAFLILLTEVGVVLSHVWARADHTYWAHVPWIDGLALANWFHAASFCSHWPIVAYVALRNIPRGRYGWRWIALAIGAELVWVTGKAIGVKGWGMWWMQMAAWIAG